MIRGMKKYLLATLLLIISITAYAQVCSYLVDSWIDDNGNQMCKYDDGTVLNTVLILYMYRVIKNHHFYYGRPEED